MTAEPAHRVHTDRSWWRLPEFTFRGRRFGVTVVDRYIFREILQPFLMALFFITTLFISVALKDVIGDLLSKGVDPLRIALFLVNLIMETLGLTLPVACLFAGILAAGRLSGDSEVTAMRAAGISFPRMYGVFLFAGLLSMLIMGYLLFYVSPASAKAREDFQNWLKTYHQLSMVKTGRFLGRADFDGMSSKGQDIYAESRTGSVLHNVQIREWQNEMDAAKTTTIQIGKVSVPLGNGFMTQIVHAREGEMLLRITEEGTPEKFIRLTNGFAVELNQEEETFQITDFTGGTMDYVIPEPPPPLGRLNVQPSSRTFDELFEFVHRLDNGGIEITPMTLIGSMANVAGVRKYNSLIGSASDAQIEGMLNRTIKLPSIQGMEVQAMQFRMLLPQLMQGKIPKNMPQQFTALAASMGEGDLSPQMMMMFAAMFDGLVKMAKETRRRFIYEIHSRMATPTACLLFFFISFPLGLVVKRSGKGMSFVLALFVFLAYYSSVMLAQAEAYGGGIDPALGAWLPNILLLVFGFYIMARRTDGFNPFYFITRPVRRLLGLLWKPLAPCAGAAGGWFLGLAFVQRIIAAVQALRLRVAIPLLRWLRYRLIRLRRRSRRSPG